MSDIKFMDIKEFLDTGFLQEANRLFFHPHGLALSVDVAEDGTVTLGNIWDDRDDPEGIWFNWQKQGSDRYKENDTWGKYTRVLAERQKHEENRSKLFTKAYDKELGYIEPVFKDLSEIHASAS